MDINIKEKQVKINSLFSPFWAFAMGLQGRFYELF